MRLRNKIIESSVFITLVTAMVLMASIVNDRCNSDRSCTCSEDAMDSQ